MSITTASTPFLILPTLCVLWQTTAKGLRIGRASIRRSPYVVVIIFVDELVKILNFGALSRSTPSFQLAEINASTSDSERSLHLPKATATCATSLASIVPDRTDQDATSPPIDITPSDVYARALSDAYFRRLEKAHIFKCV